MRSGKLFASNDPTIRVFLEDPNYKFLPDGRIFTRVHKTGKVAKDPDFWREAGHLYSQYPHIKWRGSFLLISRINYERHVGRLEQDLIVYHLDGNSKNNHPSNLKLGPQSESNKLRFTRHPAVRGNTVLTWEIVREIRQKYREGSTYSGLSWIYDLSKGHISQIINNKIWVENAKA